MCIFCKINKTYISSKINEYKFSQLIKDVYTSGQSSLVELKSSPVDLVTETDQAVEKLIIEKIKSTYPDHK